MTWVFHMNQFFDALKGIFCIILYKEKKWRFNFTHKKMRKHDFSFVSIYENVVQVMFVKNIFYSSARKCPRVFLTE